MSAYIVDKIHIDVLVSAGIAFGDNGDGIRWDASPNPSLPDFQHVTPESVNRVGRMLWAENLASVAHRYPHDVSGQRPGPADFTDSDVETYRFERVNGFITPLPVLAAIASYEYQSNENVMDWHNSEARRYCDGLRLAAIARIPGYHDLIMVNGVTTDRNYFVQ